MTKLVKVVNDLIYKMHQEISFPVDGLYNFTYTRFKDKTLHFTGKIIRNKILIAFHIRFGIIIFLVRCPWQLYSCKCYLSYEVNKRLFTCFQQQCNVQVYSFLL